MTVKERISKLLEALNDGLYERENELKLALLSSIAGESIFLLGPPGVAKSMVAGRIKYAYKDAKVFEYLMNRFSTPDEIFGPVSISELKKDKYTRVIDGYLPDAEVVFLDEIWKAGPSIQNALLTILNEKVFRNGKTESEIKGGKNVEIKRGVPMKVLISASNELPDEEAKAQGQSLDALWDRFLVRLEVECIEEWNNFKDMLKIPFLSSKEEDKKLKNIVAEPISNKEYEAWSKEIDNKDVPKDVFNVIRIIRKKIELHNSIDDNKSDPKKQIFVSDRRWRKIVRLLRTSAFLNGRTEVDLMDCFLIKHCLWSEVGQRETVSGFVSNAIQEYGYKDSLDLGEIKRDIDSFKKEIDGETKPYREIPVKELESVYGDCYEIINPPSSNSTLIKRTDFDRLNNQHQSISLYCFHSSWQQVRGGNGYHIRKGTSEFSLIINTNGIDNEYQLKTITRNENTQITKAPNEYTEKAWDERVDGLLLTNSDKKLLLEECVARNSEHFRTNLFVEPKLADIIEFHINATRTEIEKIELDIREIQNGYKKLKELETDENDGNATQ